MTSLSRRSLLKTGAVAGTALGTALGTVAAGPTLPASAGAPFILKPLPPELFTDFGTNAETRWDSVDPKRFLTDQSRLFVRNHTLTPTIDRDTWRLRVFGDGLSESRDEADAVSLSYADLRRLPVTRLTSTHECTGNGRSFFKSQQGTTGAAPRGRSALSGASRGRASGWPRFSIGSGSRPTPCRSRRPGSTPSTHRRRQLRAGASPLPGQQGPRRRAARVGGERRAAAARPRLPGATGAARLGRHREHQVAGFARSGEHRADLALEHQVVPDDRRLVPRRLPAADRQPGPFCVGAGVGRDHCPSRGGRADRPFVERRGRGRPGRRQRRRRRDLERRRGPTAPATARPGPSGATCGRSPPSGSTC